MTKYTNEDFDFDLKPQTKVTFYAAGVQFRKDWRDRLLALEEGEELQLIPELTNKFDKDAVKLLSSEDVFLGYVPAKGGLVAKNRWVLNALFEGQTLKATIGGVNTDGDPWTALLVNVEIESPKL